MQQNGMSDAARFLEKRFEQIDAKLREKELVAIYTSLRVYESDCDKAQGTLRTIASAWLLAAIGGIGLIVQSEFSATGRLDEFVAAPLRQVFLLFACMGLISLWYLDQRIYQRLLHGSFAAGCWMEEKFPEILPPIRMYIFRLNLDITRYLGWFYRAPILLLSILALFNLLGVMGGYGAHYVAAVGAPPPSFSPRISFGASGIVFVAHFLMVAFVMRFERHWPNLRGELPPSLDPILTPASPSGSRSGP